MPSNVKAKNKRIQRRKYHIRKRVIGTADRPRFAVFRSNKHLSVQIIDDERAHTLVAATTTAKALNISKGWNVEAATSLGEAVAKRALEAGIKKVVFDRGGYKFHGRVKALAESARKAGLDF